MLDNHFQRVTLSGKGVGPGGARGTEVSLVLRFVLSNNIAVPCILRGEYPNICIYALNSIPALPLLPFHVGGYGGGS